MDCLYYFLCYGLKFDIVMSIHCQLPGAESPVCVFWNETSNQWDSVNGIETKKVSRLDSGKNKTYQVNCSANHATAFAVLTTPEDEVSCAEVINKLIIVIGVT